MRNHPISSRPARATTPALEGIRARILGVVLTLALLSGCATYEYHETRNVAPIRFEDSAENTIEDKALLDVGIVLFDPGLDLLNDEIAAFSNVRQSEAVWFASQMKATLEYSNVWGSVRTMPSANTVMDLQINGKILESNGEVVKLSLSVTDATGALWYTKEYQQRASSYAYNPEVNYSRDPFHSMFVEIANDLFDYRASMTSEQLASIRSVSKVRFAQEFLPEAYDEFITEEDDRFLLARAPAANDPMIMRIDRIRARNDLFLDVIQDYYRVFNGNMAHPYQEWRKISYKEVVYERQLKSQSRKEKIAGVAAILLGILAQTSDSRYTRASGHVGIFAGADLIRIGYAKENEASLHSSTLRELSAALEAELEPSIVDLEDRSITLSGTVEDQFKEWRRLLGEMFRAENGLPLEDSEGVEGSEDATGSSLPGTAPEDQTTAALAPEQTGTGSEAQDSQ
ncbi:MAG: hypothetical protein AAF431_00525 [Pseudomonadota bacterium]